MDKGRQALRDLADTDLLGEEPEYATRPLDTNRQVVILQMLQNLEDNLFTGENDEKANYTYRALKRLLSE